MPAERRSEIRFDELEPNDTVVLETAHHVYTFRLRDGQTHTGELARGAIEESGAAVLGGTIQDKHVIDDRLRVGGCALFYSPVPTDERSFRLIITSPISTITLSRVA